MSDYNRIKSENANIYLPAYTGNLRAGNVSFSGPNVSLGNISNLHITGGTSGQVLSTDGSGTLSWTAQSNGSGSSGAQYDANTVSTGYFALPAGTTAQRPESAANGAIRMNIETGYLEIRFNSSWANTISVGLGSSAASAASSAAAIKLGTGTTTDGFYWINLPTVGPTEVYCDMNTNGGGWMLAAKVYSDGNKWNGYDSTDWTTTGVFNETQLPTYVGHIKTHVYNYFVATVGQRLSYNFLTNNLYESWTGSSLYGLMNSASVNSVNSRAAWITWSQNAGINYNFSTQPNCNQAGTNKNYSYGARIGISMNNENDCGSNDSFIGFGTKSTTYGIGSADWNGGSILNSGYQIGWIWVK